MGQNPFHPHRHQLLPPAAAVNSARTPPPTPHPCLLRRLPLLFSSSLSSAPIKTTKDTPLFRSKYPGYARSFSAPLLVPPLLLLQHCPRYRDPGSTEKIPLFSLVVHYRFYCNRPSCLSSKVYVAEHLPSRRSRTIHRTTVNLLSDHTKERTLQYRWA
ncbi:uncharacterized protein [Oryza sativa Japonica Group]|jgi:hypothetical protein|uniref:uncharacterized protein isoform X1 n=1 Tax=Oryza sativa subsp. japonica TaxID=39947 RepID=UPI0007755B44|nr:uncharacterized protein LOC107276878 isoform X2 [Oryza sativa Japonica Group]